MPGNRSYLRLIIGQSGRGFSSIWATLAQMVGNGGAYRNERR